MVRYKDGYEVIDCGYKTPCYVWKKAKGRRPYLFNGDKLVLVSRWIMERKGVIFGPKEGALHKCDNVECVRFSHLFKGTQKVNMLDAIHKGRLPMGEQKKAAKLNESDVKKIRKLYATGKYSLAILAGKYGVAKTTIVQVIKYITWRHV